MLFGIYTTLFGSTSIEIGSNKTFIGSNATFVVSTKAFVERMNVAFYPKSIGFSMRLKLITQTHGFLSQLSLPLMDCQRV